MLLALDVGNTNITIGAFDGPKLAGRWRLRTIQEQTADEWGILLRNLFTLAGLDLTGVHGVIISSVVPAVDQPLEAMSKRYFDRQPMFVNPPPTLG
jgi:type III pantothenate kinase